MTLRIAALASIVLALFVLSACSQGDAKTSPTQNPPSPTNLEGQGDGDAEGPATPDVEEPTATTEEIVDGGSGTERDGGGELTMADYFKQLGDLDAEFSRQKDELKEESDETFALDPDLSKRVDEAGGEFENLPEAFQREYWIEVGGMFGDLFEKEAVLTGIFVDGLKSLEPPAEVLDTHERAVLALQDGIMTLDELSSRMREATSQADFIVLLFVPPLGRAAEDIAGACSELQEIADEMGLEVSLECKDIVEFG